MSPALPSAVALAAVAGAIGPISLPSVAAIAGTLAAAGPLRGRRGEKAMRFLHTGNNRET